MFVCRNNTLFPELNAIHVFSMKNVGNSAVMHDKSWSRSGSEQEFGLIRREKSSNNLFRVSLADTKNDRVRLIS